MSVRLRCSYSSIKLPLTFIIRGVQFSEIHGNHTKFLKGSGKIQIYLKLSKCFRLDYHGTLYMPCQNRRNTGDPLFTLRCVFPNNFSDLGRLKIPACPSNAYFGAFSSAQKLSSPSFALSRNEAYRKTSAEEESSQSPSQQDVDFEKLRNVSALRLCAHQQKPFSSIQT